ncbi:MAG: DUF6290 family protein [Coriobacteriia bacterium]|nr:DUF6290 family protein [Coriobacteriia bacterium]
MSTTSSIRWTDEEHQLISEYAAQNRRRFSDVVKTAVMDEIENAYDLELFRKAKREYEKDPVTYSHDEVMKKFGFA